VFGLPIHRLGGTKSPIFAFVSELDDWLKNYSSTLPDEQTETSKSALSDSSSLSKESSQANANYDPSLISSAAQARSADYVALAYTVWGTVSNSNLNLVTRHFRDAIDLDPGNAAAFAGLSNVLIAEGLLGRVNAPLAYASAKAAMERAFEIDPEQPEAKCAEAWCKMVSLRDWRGARRGFDEALNHPARSTGPMLGRALLHIAEQSWQGASDLLLEAVGRNQLSVIAIAFYSWSVYLAGESERALYQVSQIRASGRSGHVLDAVEALATIQIEEPDAQIARIEALAASSPRHDVVRGALGYVYAVNGQSERARQLLDTMTMPTRHRLGDEPYSVALILIGLKENQKAVHWLEKSYQGGSFWSLGFRSDPILETLRNDPHFRQFMSKVSYPAPVDADPHPRSIG
jgi:tetratricopeptide (TPR) repeat protein